MSRGRDASTGHMAEIYVLAEIRTKTRGSTVTESRSLPMSSTCWRSQVLLQRALSLRESANVVGYGYAVGRVCAVRDGCSGSAIKYASEAEVPCQLERDVVCSAGDGRLATTLR